MKITTKQPGVLSSAHYFMRSLQRTIVVLTCLLGVSLVPAAMAQETVVYSEGFEGTNGGYTVSGDSVSWSWGVPTGNGPANAHSGTNLWGTHLSGYTSQEYNGYLDSPLIPLPALNTNQVDRVSFYAYCDLPDMENKAEFLISTNGTTWESLVSFYQQSGGGWQKYECDISAYAGQNITLRFRLYMVQGYSAGGGFHVDDIAITTYTKSGPSKILSLQAFEDLSSSCPYVAPWNGTRFQVDNDIYSVGRFESGKYRDYYTLRYPVVASNGFYNLEIQELDKEESWTDYTSLIAVDHDADAAIGTDSKGNITSYFISSLQTPISAVSSNGIDALVDIATKDGAGYAAYSQDYVDVDFGSADVTQGAQLVLGVKGFLSGKTNVNFPYIGAPAIVVQVLGKDGYYEVGRLLPRFGYSECVFDLSSYLPDYNGKVKVRFYSISHQRKYHSIDYVALATGAKPSIQVKPLTLASAFLVGVNVTNQLLATDNDSVYLRTGNKFSLSFNSTEQTLAKRDFVFVSEGYYIPQGSTYFIYTWNGSAWVMRDSYGFPTTSTLRKFDLSLFLPDPDGEYKVRIWQNQVESYAGVDYIGLEYDSTNGIMAYATNGLTQAAIQNGAVFDVKSYVSSNDGNALVYWGYYDRWIETKWTNLPVNIPPVISNVTFNGSSVSWTYTDADSDTQSIAQVQIWTGSNGNGSIVWAPDPVSGTATSLSYNGVTLTAGATYYVRVKAYDGKSWGSWSETSYTVSSGISTTTAVASSSNPSSFGDSVVFTATVGSGSGIPIGSVTFKDGSTTLSSVSIITNGTSGEASITNSSLISGAHVITATYDGGSGYLTSSGTVTQSVAKVSAIVTIGDLDQVYNGLEKSVSTSTTPTGLGVAVTYNGTNGLPVSPGSYQVIASISDVNYSGSATNTLVIEKAMPTVSQWPVATPIWGGQMLTNSALLGGSASIAGRFVFVAPETSAPEGTYVAAVRFVPSDTNNFNSVDGTVSVKVAYVAVQTGSSSNNITWNGSATMPTNGDDIVISTNVTVTLDTNTIVFGTVVIEDRGALILTNSAIFSFSGNMTNFGVIIPGDGLAQMVGTNDQLLVGGGTNTFTFYELTIDKNSPTNVVAITNGELVVYFRLHVINGVFVSASTYQDVVIETNGTLSLTGDITVSGNFTNRGTFNANGYKVTFNGTNEQYLALEAPTTFADLTVDTNSILVEVVSANNATVTGSLENYGVIRKAQNVTGVGVYDFGLAGAYNSADMSINITNLTGANPVSGISIDRIDSNYPQAPGTNVTGIYWKMSVTGSDGRGVLTLPHAGYADPKVCVYANNIWQYGRISFTANTVTCAGNNLGTSDWMVFENPQFVPTTTALVISQSTVTYGSNLTYTATVTPTAASGTVTFKDGTNILGTATLTSGTATLVTNRLSAGTRSVTAVYGGASAYASSTSDVVTQSVNKASLTVVADNQVRAYGDTNPVFTLTYSNLMSWDAPTNAFQVMPSVTTVATETTRVKTGGYPIVVTNGTSANYDLAYINGTLTITQVPLSIVVVSTNRAYGATNPTFAAVITGLKNGDNISASMTTTADTNSTPADYHIEVATVDPGAKLGCYNVTITGGTLTVTRQPLVGTVASLSRAYGSANPPFTVNYVGFVNNETTNVLTGTLGYRCVDGSSVAVGTNTVPGVFAIDVISGQTNSNYTISYVSGALTVTQAVLTVTADNVSRRYWTTNPVFTATITGFVNGQGTNILGGALGFATTATNTSNVGAYSIVPSGYTSGNYSFNYSNGTLTVTQALLSVTANSTNKVYGAPLPTFTGTNDSIAGDVGITVGYATTALASSPIGTYPITPTFTDPSNRLGNFSVTTNAGTLTINAAALTGTVASVSRVYGETNPVFTINYTGFTNGDTTSVLTGTPVFSCLDGTDVVTTNTVVGNYPIHVTTGQTYTNYTISYVDGTLAVTQAVLTVTAENKSRIYGETNPVLTAVITGFVNDEDTNAITGSPELTTLAVTNSPVGAYDITPTLNTLLATNYSFIFSNGTLTVGKADLKVVADNKSRAYGDTNPVFTAQYVGFVDGDTDAVLTGAPQLTTVAGTNSSIGTYDIVAAVGSLAATNYALTFSNATLTVTQAPMTIASVATNRTYGATNPIFSGSITGIVNNDDITATFVSVAVTNSPVTTYDITPVIADPGYKLTNYFVTTNIALLTIDKASLTVVAYDTNKTYGAVMPSLDGYLAGVVAGDDLTLSNSTTATASSPVGTYTITAGVTDPDSRLDNYTLVTTNGVFTINKAALTVTADDKTLVWGSNAPTYTVSYNGFVNGDTVASLTTVPTASVLDTIDWVGTYDIVPSGGVSTNYSFSYVDGTLTVEKGSIRIVGDNASRKYGETNPVFTATMYGAAPGETLTYTLSTVATPTSAPGNYEIAIDLVDPDFHLGLYDVSFYSGMLTIGKMSLTGVVADASRAYGATNPVFTVDYVGFKNGDTTNNLTGSLSFVCTNATGDDVTTNASVGQYSVYVVSGQAGTNYDIVYTNGTLSVTQALMVVTVDNTNRVYGTTNPVFSGTLVGVTNNDDISVSFTTAATSTSNVAQYDITPVLNDPDSLLSNYFVITNLGTLDVTKASLTLVASNATRLYGQTNPTFEGSLTGILNNDGITAQYSTLATSTSPVGDYTITAALVDPNSKKDNYTLTTTNGTLSVTAASLTATVNNQTRVYGGTNSPVTLSFSGFVNSDTTAIVTGIQTNTYYTNTIANVMTIDTNTVIGTYGINVTGLSAPNYSISYVDGTLTVTQALLTITADNAVRGYGQTNPVFTGSITGFVNDETTNVIVGEYGLTTTAATNSVVGLYPILITTNTISALNYAFVTNTGTLSVTGAVLTVTADNKSKGYGASNPTLTYTITGYVNPSDSAMVTGQPAISTTATASSAVGTYTITVTNGTLSSPNYSFVYANGTLSVAAATLTATVNNQARVYGGTNPPVTLSFSGFVNSDTTAIVTGIQTNTYYTNTIANVMTIDTNTVIGTYGINVTGLSAPNYSISYVDGTLTVTQALLTITADNAVRGYGQTNPVFTGSITGFVNDETTNVIVGEYGLTTTAATNSVVGLYPILITTNTISALNYAFVTNTGTLSVTGAVLTVTADNKSKGYGASNPTLTYTITGYVNPSDSAMVTGQPAISTTATASSAVGTYAITISNGTLSSPNYSFAYANGTLTVTKGTITIVADSKSRIYGAANPQFSLSYSGLPDGEVLDTLPIISTTATATSPVGNYPITLSGGLDNNYTYYLVNGILTVTPATLTAVAADASRSYGQANPTFSGSIVGILNGDPITATYTTTATQSSPAGSYAVKANVTATGNQLQNYNLVTTDGTLTVSKVALTGTIWNATRAYGQDNAAFGITYSGYVNNDNDTSLSGTLSLICTNSKGTPVTASTPVGTYAIKVGTSQTSPNYNISYTSGSLTITKAALTITADSKTRAYGQANPELTFSYSGFANGETKANLTSVPVATTTATQASPVGTYPITLAGGSSDNYAITLQNSVLTVMPAQVVLTADNKTRTYGQTNPVLTVTASGFVNGETVSNLSALPVATTTATATSPAGTYPITVTGAGTNSNYAVSLQSGTLTVAPAALSIKADSATRPFGQTNPVLTGTITGIVNGDTITATYTTTATESSPSGTYPITPAAVADTNVLANYAVTLTEGTLTINSQLVITSEPANYVVGAAAINVDTNATLNAGSSISFDSVTLAVTVSTNLASGDTLAIEPRAESGITTTSTNVSYNGQVIASCAKNTGTLTVRFNVNATGAAITDLLRQITFATTNMGATNKAIQLALIEANQTLVGVRVINVDRPPQAQDDTIQATAGVTITIPFSAVLANDTDMDGDTLTVSVPSAVTARNGNVVVATNGLVYTPAITNTTSDSFTYVVSDGRGGSAQAKVTVQLVKKQELTIETDLSTGHVTLQMGGQPGVTYRIDASEDLKTWTPLTTAVADAYGIIKIVDPDLMKAARFYRLVQP